MTEDMNMLNLNRNEMMVMGERRNKLFGELKESVYSKNIEDVHKNLENFKIE
jgi:hypothetical protein